MSDKTKIEWADATWNPVTGCTKVSPGCDHCYIDRAFPFRLSGTKFVKFCPRCKGHGIIDAAHTPCPDCLDGTVAGNIGATTGVWVHPNRLDQPLRWKRPRRVFVNSLSDLFHESVSDEYIARVWAVMALAPQHRFMVLTKRHGRMRSLLSSSAFADLMGESIEETNAGVGDYSIQYPLPNVWLGVTVEDQKRADLRIPALLNTPAAVRFLSCEPLIGPVELEFIHYFEPKCNGCSGIVSPAHEPSCGTEPGAHWGIDWVICGGESGPDARPMHPGWARSLRDQCQGAGVPFHFKQWGEWAPEDQTPEDVIVPGRVLFDGATGCMRLGKKANGRSLDGRTWDGEPS